ncbi:MAG: diguanylate cyclase [Reyranella sp.]|nr:MAG: diguanylate cyclase [Reyranella sp.]
MPTETLLQHFLMFVVVPVWLLAGLADYACHRSARIEETSGVLESLLHIFQFIQVGLPLLAALFLQINAGVLAIMFTGLVLHQATAIWDVRYANHMRKVPPVEQHLHGVLEMTPAIATAVVCILHWSQFLALLGIGEATFALELKRAPLPTWYLTAVMVGVAVGGVVPYGEELMRTGRQARFTRARRTAAGS